MIPSLGILDKVRRLLTGEPLRAIVYGAALVVWIVCGIAAALGYQGLPTINLDDALLQATAAAAGLTEIARRFTYSPNTVEVIAAVAAATGDPTVSAPPP